MDVMAWEGTHLNRRSRAQVRVTVFPVHRASDDHLKAEAKYKATDSRLVFVYFATKVSK